jgi:iron complex transport system substrate-binding protein
VPELVTLAGGRDELGKKRGESIRISWKDVVDYAPEVLIIMPCGFNLRQTMQQIWSVFGARESPFYELPAVRDGRVYGMDANSYFARPGPRVVEGAEILAHIIHPEVFGDLNNENVFQKVDVDLLRGLLKVGKDYYLEGEALVFTADYLRRRGYCCDSGCRHCPYS